MFTKTSLYFILFFFFEQISILPLILQISLNIIPNEIKEILHIKLNKNLFVIFSIFPLSMHNLSKCITHLSLTSIKIVKTSSSSRNSDNTVFMNQIFITIKK